MQNQNYQKVSALFVINKYLEKISLDIVRDAFT